MSIISIERLTKFYRVHEKSAGFKNTIKDLFNRKYIDKKAVDDVSFSIAEGEIVGLLGENGAGKTTTLKMLTGILYPTNGSVSVAGFTPTGRKRAFLKKIRFVMGNKSDINWDLPAIDTFRYQQLLYDVPDVEYKKNLGMLSELLSVSHLLDTQIRRLSLGERMKMELINSFLYSPEIIFLDEPTIGLDLASQIAIRSFLKNYRQEKKNTTILITSHYMDDIEETCDRVILLTRVQLAFDGSIGELKKPDTLFKEIILSLMNGGINPAPQGKPFMEGLG
jgi:ABC-2 type transport system ATP-binding protein